MNFSINLNSFRSADVIFLTRRFWERAVPKDAQLNGYAVFYKIQVSPFL